MRRLLPTLGTMLAIAASAYFLLYIIFKNVLLTVACAMVGQEHAFLPWLIFMTIFYIAIMLGAWTVIKGRDGTAKREYLASLGSAVYDRRTDGKLISHDKQYRAELLAYAVIVSLQILLSFGLFYWIFCFPVMYGAFHVYNRLLWRRLHRSWAEGRMRLNPNEAKG